MKRHVAETAASLSPISVLAVIALCLGCTGCTIIGMGIGSAIPVYERASPPWRVEDSPAGTQVRIRMEDGRMLEGTVESQPDPFVVHDSRTGRSTTIDAASLWGAERKVGSEWAAGAFLGGVVDVTVIIVGGAILASQFKMPSNLNVGAAPY